MFSRALALVAAVVLLAACGDLPRPFEPGPREAGRLDPLLPADATGIAVVIDDPALAAAVVSALADREVPASVGEGPGAVLAGARRDGLIRWRLRGPGGKRLARFTVAEGDAAAAETAARVAAALAPVAPPRAVVVVPVAGAPPGGGAPLTRAMARALEGLGLRVLGPGVAPDDALYVLGSVASAAAGPGLARIEVVWEVIARDGRRLGVVRQANTVPAADLDAALVPLAGAIADAGAEGVRTLVARLARR